MYMSTPPVRKFLADCQEPSAVPFPVQYLAMAAARRGYRPLLDMTLYRSRQFQEPRSIAMNFPSIVTELLGERLLRGSLRAYHPTLACARDAGDHIAAIQAGNGRDRVVVFEPTDGTRSASGSTNGGPTGRNRSFLSLGILGGSGVSGPADSGAGIEPTVDAPSTERGEGDEF